MSVVVILKYFKKRDYIWLFFYLTWLKNDKFF